MCQKSFANAGEQQVMEEEEIALLEDASTESQNSALCMRRHAGRSVSPQHYTSWQTTHLQLVWAFHFGVTFLVLLYGALNNGDRYVCLVLLLRYWAFF